MMPSSSVPPHVSTETVSTLSPQAQTGVSFLIFLHLFALAVGVTANESPSRLETALRNRTGIRAYLETMMMDLSYAYAFTFGPSTEPMGDSQAWIEVELTLPEGGKRTEFIPAPDIALRQRLRRYETFARRSVGQAGNPNTESLLPYAVASRLVAETGATGGTLHCRWRQLPLQAFQTTGDQIRTSYEARILVVDGQVDLLKIEAASESAPKSGGQKAESSGQKTEGSKQ